MGSLLVVEGPGQGKYYPLGRRTTVIGRLETCSFQIVDDKISRKHAQIRFDPRDETYRVLDMRSSNGTLVNGKRIEEDTALRDQDQIRVGDTTMVFYDREFDDRDSAFNHYKQQGQRGRPTVGE